ncbi:hypothetical protein GCM10009550_65800 [Actinocorallia libanotica]|uniref:HD-GYP domain-containing protein n=1 Tax=Actinocorallia libanotica TaxID=46162 RepID=A0ABP4CC43_9ACTN
MGDVEVRVPSGFEERVQLHIVGDIGFLEEARAGIMHHHEKLNGRGYPLDLAGDEIPEFARIIGVADAFDAMTSTRSYRKAKPVRWAVEELQRCAGIEFDPAFVTAFVKALNRHGWQLPDPEPVLEGQPVAVHDHDDYPPRG